MELINLHLPITQVHGEKNTTDELNQFDGVPVLAVEESLPQLPLVVDIPPLPLMHPLEFSSQPITLSESDEGVANSTASKENYVPSSSSLEVSNRNLIWANKSMSKAEKIWHFAKEIGVSHVGEELAYIGRIQEMEDRDKDGLKSKEIAPGDK